MPEILLPTASKQNEIHEDVKQLKESSGAGKEYETRIHRTLIGKGEEAEISFQGILESLIVESIDSGYSTIISEMRVDDIYYITEQDENFYVSAKDSLKLDLRIPVKNSFSISCHANSAERMRVIVLARHEVSE